MENDITCVLNVYRRTEYLKIQIEAILNQTVKPKEIFIWVNNHEDNEEFDYSDFKEFKIFKNNHNWKYHGRFAASMLAKTKYVAIFDDDTIPGSRWFENCIENIEKHNGIMGSAGIILNSYNYSDHSRCGWPTKNENIQEVDLVGHSWFFKKEWLKYFWQEEPYTWENGEDIQFSYFCKKYGNIKTFCPPHPIDNRDIHGSLVGEVFGSDKKASYLNYGNEFYQQRDDAVRDAIDNGWNTVRGIKRCY
jgi:hypothetical protein